MPSKFKMFRFAALAATTLSLAPPLARCTPRAKSAPPRAATPPGARDPSAGLPPALRAAQRALTRYWALAREFKQVDLQTVLYRALSDALGPDLGLDLGGDPDRGPKGAALRALAAELRHCLPDPRADLDADAEEVPDWAPGHKVIARWLAERGLGQWAEKEKGGAPRALGAAENPFEEDAQRLLQRGSAEGRWWELGAHAWEPVRGFEDREKERAAAARSPRNGSGTGARPAPPALPLPAPLALRAVRLADRLARAFPHVPRPVTARAAVREVLERDLGVEFETRWDVEEEPLTDARRARRPKDLAVRDLGGALAAPPGEIQGEGSAAFLERQRRAMGWLAARGLARAPAGRVQKLADPKSNAFAADHERLLRRTADWKAEKRTGSWWDGGFTDQAPEKGWPRLDFRGLEVLLARAWGPTRADPARLLPKMPALPARVLDRFRHLFGPDGPRERWGPLRALQPATVLQRALRATLAAELGVDFRTDEDIRRHWRDARLSASVGAKDAALQELAETLEAGFKEAREGAKKNPKKSLRATGTSAALLKWLAERGLVAPDSVGSGEKIELRDPSDNPFLRDHQRLLDRGVAEGEWWIQKPLVAAEAAKAKPERGAKAA